MPGSQEIENNYPFEVSDLAIIQTQVVQWKIAKNS